MDAMSIYGHPYINRPDLSPFIFHLCGDHIVPGAPETASKRLLGILGANTIRAFRPFGVAVSEIRRRIDSNELDARVLETQKACCFTETPLSSLSSYFERLSRQQRFAPYGICIGRAAALSGGASPVWYGNENRLASIDSLVSIDLDKLTAGWSNPYALHALVLAPRFELMKRNESLKKMFWWEREWRQVGDFGLPNRGAVLCPQIEREYFQAQLKKNPYLSEWITIHPEDPIADSVKKLTQAIPDNHVVL